MEDINKRVKEIEERNFRVELDKSFETSMFRKIILAILTYFVVVLFFFAAKLPNPFINSLVPTIGFLISTLSLSFIKKRWVKFKLSKHKKN